MLFILILSGPRWVCVNRLFLKTFPLRFLTPWNMINLFSHPPSHIRFIKIKNNAKSGAASVGGFKICVMTLIWLLHIKIIPLGLHSHNVHFINTDKQIILEDCFEFFSDKRQPPHYIIICLNPYSPFMCLLLSFFLSLFLVCLYVSDQSTIYEHPSQFSTYYIRSWCTIAKCKTFFLNLFIWLMHLWVRNITSWNYNWMEYEHLLL